MHQETEGNNNSPGIEGDSKAEMGRLKINSQGKLIR